MLRGYLYDFQERAVGYVLDNPEMFQDQTEAIRMVTPPIF